LVAWRRTPAWACRRTGRENLLLQGRVYGMRGAELNKRADELLRFGLGEVGKRFVKTYSGGMKRKLDVALDLAHSPQCSSRMRRRRRRRLAKLSFTERGRGDAEVDHLEEADQLARNLAIVDQGRIVTEGTPDELKAHLNGDAVTLELAVGADPDNGKRPGADGGPRGVDHRGVQLRPAAAAVHVHRIQGARPDAPLDATSRATTR